MVPPGGALVARKAEGDFAEFAFAAGGERVALEGPGERHSDEFAAADFA
jgi:hypothetical protein